MKPDPNASEQADAVIREKTRNSGTGLECLYVTCQAFHSWSSCPTMGAHSGRILSAHADLMSACAAADAYAAAERSRLRLEGASVERLVPGLPPQYLYFVGPAECPICVLMGPHESPDENDRKHQAGIPRDDEAVPEDWRPWWWLQWRGTPRGGFSSFEMPRPATPPSEADLLTELAAEHGYAVWPTDTALTRWIVIEMAKYHLGVVGGHCGEFTAEEAGTYIRQRSASR